MDVNTRDVLVIALPIIGGIVTVIIQNHIQLRKLNGLTQKRVEESKETGHLEGKVEVLELVAEKRDAADRRKSTSAPT
jgi:hypothetical protein